MCLSLASQSYVDGVSGSMSGAGEATGCQLESVQLYYSLFVLVRRRLLANFLIDVLLGNLQPGPGRYARSRTIKLKMPIVRWKR